MKEIKEKEINNLEFTKNHPVSFVKWVEKDLVIANDYNPNSVAPPEMELLRLSIEKDGYTQPIVVWKNGDNYEVVDGFHRHLVGKKLGLTHLPVVIINENVKSRSDRISSTIRHNRARGKHKVESMSDIVVELKKRNWSTERICRELGMEEDEVLRLCQITGLSELFQDQEFSKSWDIKDSTPDFVELTDEITEEEKEINKFRTVNTSDENRVFHTYDKWECYKAGFYKTTKEGMTKEQCEEEYKNFLSDEHKFRMALSKVIVEWEHSCEHYLTNSLMNRIAWLGQAALCYSTGIPSTFRAGFHLLSDQQQEEANKIALEYLNRWLENNGMEKVSLDQAMTDRQATIY